MDERQHRDRLAWWEMSEEQAEEEWREAQASARMLGCVMVGCLGVVLAVLAIVGGPPLLRWLGGG